MQDLGLGIKEKIADTRPKVSLLTLSLSLSLSLSIHKT